MSTIQKLSEECQNQLVTTNSLFYYTNVLAQKLEALSELINTNKTEISDSKESISKNTSAIVEVLSQINPVLYPFPTTYKSLAKIATFNFKDYRFSELITFTEAQNNSGNIEASGDSLVPDDLGDITVRSKYLIINVNSLIPPKAVENLSLYIGGLTLINTSFVPQSGKIITVDVPVESPKTVTIVLNYYRENVVNMNTYLYLRTDVIIEPYASLKNIIVNTKNNHFQGILQADVTLTDPTHCIEPECELESSTQSINIDDYIKIYSTYWYNNHIEVSFSILKAPTTKIPFTCTIKDKYIQKWSKTESFILNPNKTIING